MNSYPANIFHLTVLPVVKFFSCKCNVKRFLGFSLGSVEAIRKHTQFSVSFDIDSVGFAFFMGNRV